MSNNGSRTGVLLISSEGIELTYVLQFEFPTTNNETEYEAVIIEIQLALKLKAKRIVVHSNSVVVVNQILNSYQAKGKRMIRYYDKVRALIQAFVFFQIIRIP